MTASHPGEKWVCAFTEKDCDRFLVLAGNLYNLLEENNCLGKHFHHRSTVLKVIFKLLDVEEPRLLLKLARLILAVSISFCHITVLNIDFFFFIFFFSFYDRS